MYHHTEHCQFLWWIASAQEIVFLSRKQELNVFFLCTDLINSGALVTKSCHVYFGEWQTLFEMKFFSCHGNKRSQTGAMFSVLFYHLGTHYYILYSNAHSVNSSNKCYYFSKILEIKDTTTWTKLLLLWYHLSTSTYPIPSSLQKDIFAVQNMGRSKFCWLASKWHQFHTKMGWHKNTPTHLLLQMCRDSTLRHFCSLKIRM